jgi:hypothetical protein
LVTAFIEPIVALIWKVDMDRPCFGDIYEGMDNMMDAVTRILERETAKINIIKVGSILHVGAVLICRWEKFNIPFAYFGTCVHL